MSVARLGILLVALAASTAERPATRAAKSAPPAAWPKQVLPFIQDDYSRALAQARARKTPLFIEAWAPW